MALPTQSVTIIGKLWFSRNCGNTYFTSTILVDGEMVEKIGGYGSGMMYEQESVDWLERNGYMPDREHHPHGSGEPGWRYFRDDRNIKWFSMSVDVERKMDL